MTYLAISEESDYDIEKEILFNGVIKYICTPKERECDHCNKQIRYDKLSPVKFPTIKNNERYMIDALICSNCYPQVRELINNNPYRRRM